MNQIMIGKFIAQKRREKNLTQEQLAEKLSVSNKTISKWECGNSMPDYNIIEPLCFELDITIYELIKGKANDQSAIQTYDNQQILELIEKVQQLEKQKQILLGIMLMVMGIALLSLSQVVGGTNFKDFISGLLLGLSLAEMLIGIYCVANTFVK